MDLRTINLNFVYKRENQLISTSQNLSIETQEDGKFSGGAFGYL